MIALSNMAKVAMAAMVFLSTSGEAQKSSLRGSKSKLIRQNEVADKENLTRLQDDKQIARFVRNGLLIALPTDTNVIVDELLPQNRRYARPWTVYFLENLGAAFHKQFGQPIPVTSAVRDSLTQDQLTTINLNAAPAAGPLASSHLTGATIDVEHRWMTTTQKKWVEAWLLERQEKGWIEATKERQEAVYHIMVFRTYGVAPAKAKKRSNQ